MAAVGAEWDSGLNQLTKTNNGAVPVTDGNYHHVVWSGIVYQHQLHGCLC